MRKGLMALMVVFGLLLAVGPVGAQDVETGSGGVWEWIDANDVMLVVVVVVALVLAILRPAIIKLVEGLATSVPEGFARDAIASIKDGVISTLERYIEARQRDAALTESPLDDAALAAIREEIAGLKAKLNELLKPGVG